MQRTNHSGGGLSPTCPGSEHSSFAEGGTPLRRLRRFNRCLRAAVEDIDLADNLKETRSLV